MSLTVKVDPKILTFAKDYPARVKAGFEQAEDILSAFVAQSIRQRWYRTGTSLRSYKMKTEQARNSIRVLAQSGTAYDAFGEYGTGVRGRLSGVPYPSGWRYGSKPGMKARQPYSLALRNALPAIMATVNAELRKFG